MARTFSRKDRLTAKSDLDVTPLIDLAFSLLIIFMISAPLLEQSIDINLPKDKSTAKSNEKPKQEVIGIDAGGQVFWGNEAVSLERLDEYLRQAAQLEVQPVIIIRADETLPYQKVIDVLAQVKGQGLTKISLNTIRP